MPKGPSGSGKTVIAQHFKKCAMKRLLNLIYVQVGKNHDSMPYGTVSSIFWNLANPLQNIKDFDKIKIRKTMVKVLVGRAYPSLRADPKRLLICQNELIRILGLSRCQSENQLVKNDTMDMNTLGEQSRNSSAKFIRNNSSKINVKNMRTKARAIALFNINKKIAVSTGTDGGGSGGGGSGGGSSSSMNLTPVEDHSSAQRRGGFVNGIKLAEISTNDCTRKSYSHDKLVSNVLFNVIAMLLTNRPSAIIIDDADNCDELSWIEISKWLDLKTQCSVLLSMTLDPTLIQQNKLLANLGTIKSNISQYGIKFNSSNTIILNDSKTIIIELKALNEIEIRQILNHFIVSTNDDGGNSIPDTLVRDVLIASEGNAYWCQTIARFIRDRGLKFFNESLQHENKLNFLVLCRLEGLTNEQQLAAKYASVVGFKIIPSLLEAIIPKNLHIYVRPTLDAICDHGLIRKSEEFSEDSYLFSNDFVMQALYQLIPPR